MGSFIVVNQAGTGGIMMAMGHTFDAGAQPSLPLKQPRRGPGE